MGRRVEKDDKHKKRVKSEGREKNGKIRKCTSSTHRELVCCRQRQQELFTLECSVAHSNSVYCCEPNARVYCFHFTIFFLLRSFPACFWCIGCCLGAVFFRNTQHTTDLGLVYILFLLLGAAQSWSVYKSVSLRYGVGHLTVYGHSHVASTLHLLLPQKEATTRKSKKPEQPKKAERIKSIKWNIHSLCEIGLSFNIGFIIYSAFSSCTDTQSMCVLVCVWVVMAFT